MKFQFHNHRGTRGVVPVATKGMVRKVRKVLEAARNLRDLKGQSFLRIPATLGK